MGIVRRGVRLTSALAVVAAYVACGGGDPPSQTVTALVTPAGANVTGPAGVLVAIPAGAVTSDFTLSVTTMPRATPPSGQANVAIPLSLTPKGQTFAADVVLTIPLSGGLPAGRAITDVVVMQGDLGTQVFASVPTVPAGPSAVTVAVRSLGDFVTVVPTAATEIDAGVGPADASAPTDASLPPDAGTGLARFTDNGDGTLSDSRSTLVWQQVAAASTSTAAAASTYCNGLALPGGPWRLPEAIELATLLDYGRANPALDPLLMGPFDAVFHTITPYGLAPGTDDWQVDPNVGFVARGLLTNPGYARCVAGPTGQFNPAFTPTGTGTVMDPNAQLEWQQADDGTPRLLADATTYCAGLNLGGTGFRLPTVEEMIRLIKYDGAGPMIDLTAFPTAANADYWTSTPRAGSPQHWYVAFTTGAVSAADLSSAMLRVRCVR